MLDANLSRLVNTLHGLDRILDVGGWHAPLNRATHVIDIMPYETRRRDGALLRDRWPEEYFTAGTYLQLDLCHARWPFPDQFFDFVFCVHTLEDLRDPVRVCEEINRVGKAGYVEVPSRLAESTRGVERPRYCGFYHHRWLCEVQGTSITFQFKPAMLHASRRFHLRKPWYKRVNPLHESVGFFWEGRFDYEERIIVDRAEVQEDLRRFKARYRNRRDVFILKWPRR